MSSFTEEVKSIVEQQQKAEKAAKEAKELEGRVETLDEIAETIYEVVKERILRVIKEGTTLTEKEVNYSGLFKSKKTITERKYVGISVIIGFESSAFLAVNHSRWVDRDEDFGEIINIKDSFNVKLIERSQYQTLRGILYRKFNADNIKHDYEKVFFLDKKKEEIEKEKNNYKWGTVTLHCKYYLSEE